uniref:Proteolipid protein 2 n=1 Tax=Astyanax mexicanus TaxID=7994 RepID=A0A8B9KER8_ASTMX
MQFFHCSLSTKKIHDRLYKYTSTFSGTLLFIIIICFAASAYGGYSALAICEMIFAIIFFVIFMMDFDKQIQFINWTWTDLFRAGIGAVLYIATSLFCVIGGSGDGARIAGGVFGLIAGILFGYDAYTVFQDIKNTRGRAAASTDRISFKQ